MTVQVPVVVRTPNPFMAEHEDGGAQLCGQLNHGSVCPQNQGDVLVPVTLACELSG